MQERTIGIIGLGIMGSAVSGNLLQDGFDVIGYDVLIERVRALEALGGRGATSVRGRRRSARHDLAAARHARAWRRRLG